MSLVRWLAVASLVLTGCATSQPEKISWAEAMKPWPKPLRKRDGAFELVLQRFIDSAQTARQSAASGAAMPAERIEAWAGLLTHVDDFLAKDANKMTAIDVVRARLVVESELEFDSQAYGDIPVSTAVATQDAVRRLSKRLSDLIVVREQLHVDPRKFSWPVSPVIVTSPFGDRVHPITGNYGGHRGVDLLAEIAQPVHAAYAGTVVFAGWNGGHGKQVQLLHDAKWGTRYSHLSSWWVKPGELVHKGQIIGVAGSTGESTGPHVHFELVREGFQVDPEEELPLPAPPSQGGPLAEVL